MIYHFHSVAVRILRAFSRTDQTLRTSNSIWHSLAISLENRLGGAFAKNLCGPPGKNMVLRRPLARRAHRTAAVSI